MKAGPPRALRLALAGVAVMLLVAAGGETSDFMPKGGRALLVDVVAPTAADLAAIRQEKRTEAQWLEFAKAQKKPLTEKEQATLAAYLAVNMPTANGAAALPPDGRDLAWEGCQSCHSLFAGYLTQTGSATRWRNMFLAPFHRNIRMSAQEREEFARYSEINMPMKVEDIPAELRF
ncbi:MAG TPA: hypothetical protein VHA82_03455 [Ramlibacter sp.]|uniref:hypothetical protein n=1 Tax=Ramlibacter sp. TaxID=1917967 RepID=UPI002CEBECDD|nr:hypothetical protein [Ramlibacter sp.]HVZ42844.1 hypothetical protein [Ramlibacter sp.]